MVHLIILGFQILYGYIGGGKDVVPKAMEKLSGGS